MSTDLSRKRVGRKRRVAGWTLLVLGVLIAAVWLASGWWYLDSYWGPRRVLVSGGVLESTDGWGRSGFSWKFARLRQVKWVWWNGPGKDVPGLRHFGLFTEMHAGGGQNNGGNVMLWPVPLLFGVPGALLVRSGRRAWREAHADVCHGCGYSLAGLQVGAACPECGRGSKKLKTEMS